MLFVKKMYRLCKKWHKGKADDKMWLTKKQNQRGSEKGGKSHEETKLSEKSFQHGSVYGNDHVIAWPWSCSGDGSYDGR